MAQPAQRTRPDPKPGEAQNRAAKVTSVDVEKRRVTFVASTEAVDSHGTVLVQDWDLRRFDANPVILWAHNATLGLDELPIGRSVRHEVVNGALEVEVEFAGSDISPLAERVFQAYRQEFLRACSVGFNPRSYRWEMRDDREVLVLFDNELLELSCVPVGSNPDALARALASNPGRMPTTETDDMTPEQAALLALATRAGEILGEKDPAAIEARLRGLVEVAARAEKTGADLVAAQRSLDALSRRTIIEKAVRETRLAPEAEWSDDQRAIIDGFSAIAPPSTDGKATRSPLEVYLSTLTPRVAIGQRAEPKHPAAPAAPSTPAAPFGRSADDKHVERARAEKNARRATGHMGPRVTDAPAPAPSQENS